MGISDRYRVSTHVSESVSEIKKLDPCIPTMKLSVNVLRGNPDWRRLYGLTSAATNGV